MITGMSWGATETKPGLYPAVYFMGEYETVRGVIVRSAERVRRLEREYPLPGWGPGVSPQENFWNLRRSLVQSGAFWQEIDGSQFSIFVSENIAIMLDSGVGIVAYYFNF